MAKTWSTGDTCQFTKNNAIHTGTILYITENYNGWPDMAAIDDITDNTQTFVFVNKLTKPAI